MTGFPNLCLDTKGLSVQGSCPDHSHQWPGISIAWPRANLNVGRHSCYLHQWNLPTTASKNSPPNHNIDQDLWLSQVFQNKARVWAFVCKKSAEELCQESLTTILLRKSHQYYKNCESHTHQSPPFQHIKNNRNLMEFFPLKKYI